MWQEFLSFTEDVAIPMFNESFEAILFWFFVALLAVLFLGVLMFTFTFFLCCASMKFSKPIPKPLLEQMEQVKKQAQIKELCRLQREEVILALLLDLSARLPEHDELMCTENDHSIYVSSAERALDCVCVEIKILDHSLYGDRSEEIND